MGETRAAAAEAMELPVLPLRGVLPLPGLPMTVGVRRPLAAAAVTATSPEAPRIALLAQRDAGADAPGQEVWGAEDFRSLGVLAVVLNVERDPHGTLQVVLEPRERLRVLSVELRGEALVARVETVPSVPAPDDVETAALVSTLKSLFQRRLAVDPDADPGLLPLLDALEDPGRLADAVVGRLEVRGAERRAVLEELSVRPRLQEAVRLVGKSLDVAEMARRIEGEVHGRVGAEQRVELLRAQLEVIRRQLGLGRDPRVAALRARLPEVELPPLVASEMTAELERLEDAGLQGHDRASAVVRLETLLALPWTTLKREPLRMEHVRAFLNRDHRGQAEAKRRLLDALAAGVLRPDGRIPPICLVGPSGVGKSSLAHGLGEALERPVVHVRLSGIQNSDELLGERRLHPGAKPGRLLEALRGVGTRDPVIVLDGLDDLALGFPGDLEALLLPLLDPDRRAAFEDRWLGVPIDLSAAVVVATAQLIDVLPSEVRDLLVEIPLRGYMDEEKREIARDHLLPALAREVGLDEDLALADETLEAIVDGWTFESGVHGLQVALRAIVRRIASRRAAGERGPLPVRPQDLPAVLGPRRRHIDRVDRSCIPGLAMGLAWTPAGGQVLFIEAAAVPGSGRVKLTGSLGAVMKESAEAAITWLREHAPKLGDSRRLDLHVHVPAGAVPKDGPSAGIALLVAIASAISKRVARHDLAMTGEITLRGQVLPVGGIREKVMAAPRAGIRTLLLPRLNEQDLAEVPPEILRGLEVHLVDRVEEVLPLALGADVECEPTVARNATVRSKRGRKVGRQAAGVSSKRSPQATRKRKARR